VRRIFSNTRRTIVLAVFIIFAGFVGVALAWGGNGIVTDISCPEVHVKLNVNKTESNKWGWVVKQDDSKVISSGTFAKNYSNTPYVIGNVYATDNGEHTFTVYVGSANNPTGDVGDRKTTNVVNCGPPARHPWTARSGWSSGSAGPGSRGTVGPKGSTGPAGPQGPKGDTGASGATLVPLVPLVPLDPMVAVVRVAVVAHRASAPRSASASSRSTQRRTRHAFS
jgi:hypothetical protein